MKKEFKGSPGPWVYGRTEYDELIVSDDEGGICEVWEWNESEDEGPANARLIAAAPELLEALQKTCELIKDFDNRNTGNDKYGALAIQYGDNLKIIEKALGAYENLKP